MKKAVSLSVYPAGPGAPVLFSGGSEANLARISALGYDGVDLFVKDPAGQDTADTVRLLRKYGLGIGVIMPAALVEQGLTLGDPDESVRAECVRRIADICKLAGENGAMVSLGLVRGKRRQAETLDAFYSRFAGSCQSLVTVADACRVPLVIEPINRYEMNTILRVSQGLEFIRRYGLPLYLMIDTFHMNIEEASMEQAIRAAAPYTKHVHFLDSNRLAPAMGHLEMARYYRLLEELGYDGYLCLEALPKPDGYTCAKRGAAFFQTMERTAGQAGKNSRPQ